MAARADGDLAWSRIQVLAWTEVPVIEGCPDGRDQLLGGGEEGVADDLPGEDQAERGAGFESWAASARGLAPSAQATRVRVRRCRGPAREAMSRFGSPPPACRNETRHNGEMPG